MVELPQDLFDPILCPPDHHSPKPVMIIPRRLEELFEEDTLLGKSELFKQIRLLCYKGYKEKKGPAHIWTPFPRDGGLPRISFMLNSVVLPVHNGLRKYSITDSFGTLERLVSISMSPIAP